MATPPVYTPPPAPKATKKGVKTPVSRMAPRLAPKPKAPPQIPLVYTTQIIKKLAKAKKKIKVTLGGRAPVDEQFDAKVWFSEAFGDNAGTTYSEPLEIEDRTAAAGQLFYWRCEITQHRVDPLLQGFETRWDILTAGWTFQDGYGATIYHEAISNPLVITRVIKAPATITERLRVRVVVTKKYQP